MTRLWRCDWCQEVTDDRSDIMLVDLTELSGGSESQGLHVHPDCLPEDVREVVGA